MSTKFLPAIGGVLLICAAPALGQLSHGDIVYSRDGAGVGPNNVIYKLAAGTGDPIVVSHTGVRGSGPDFGQVVGGLAVDADYNILLLGYDRWSVFKVDPTTGDRSILSGQGVGSGPALEGPNDIGLSQDHSRIYVTAGISHS